jgi:hypothetical protein
MAESPRKGISAILPITIAARRVAVHAERQVDEAVAHGVEGAGAGATGLGSRLHLMRPATALLTSLHQSDCARVSRCAGGTQDDIVSVIWAEATPGRQQGGQRNGGERVLELAHASLSGGMAACTATASPGMRLECYRREHRGRIILSRGQPHRRFCRWAPARPQPPAEQHTDDQRVDGHLGKVVLAGAHPEEVQQAEQRDAVDDAVQGLPAPPRPARLMARLNEVAASGSMLSSAALPTRMKGRLAMSARILPRSSPMSSQAIAQEVQQPVEEGEQAEHAAQAQPAPSSRSTDAAASRPASGTVRAASSRRCRGSGPRPGWRPGGRPRRPTTTRRSGSSASAKSSGLTAGCSSQRFMSVDESEELLQVHAGIELADLRPRSR